MDELTKAIREVEQATSKLSDLLFPLDAEVERVTGRTLGELKVGEKIKVAKLIIAAQQKLK